MKNALLLAALLLAPIASRAQDDPKAKAIVDRLMAQAKGWTSFEADFSSRLQSAKDKLDVKQEGNMKVKGKRFRLVLDKNTIINDGAVLYTYSKETNEVTLNDPAEMERRAITESDAVVTVSDEVLAQIEARYGMPANTMILPNAPLARDIPVTLPALDRGPGARPRVVYQGSLSDNGSHYDLREIFAAVARSGVDLTIRPSRPHHEYAELASSIGAHYHDPVAPHELMAVLPRYDWGWAGFNASINRAHIDTALPNKAFEYLAAGLPIIALRHKALERFVEGEGVGVVIDDPADAARAIADADWRALRARVREVRMDFTAERNAQRLAGLYNRVLSSRRDADVAAPV